MITATRDKNTCNKYSVRDANGNVHCFECPLRKGTGSYDFRCKANSHYNRNTGEWEHDESEKGGAK